VTRKSSREEEALLLGRFRDKADEGEAAGYGGRDYNPAPASDWHFW
ncbi:unnamed protein product, partial [marine sediment metagenome]